MKKIGMGAVHNKTEAEQLKDANKMLLKENEKLEEENRILLEENENLKAKSSSASEIKNKK